MTNREYELYDYHISQNSEKESENNTISELQSRGSSDAYETTSEVDRQNENGIVQ